MAKYIATQRFRDKNNFDNLFEEGDSIGNKLSAERIEELTKKGFIKEEKAATAKAPAKPGAKTKAEAKPEDVKPEDGDNSESNVDEEAK